MNVRHLNRERTDSVTLDASLVALVVGNRNRNASNYLPCFLLLSTNIIMHALHINKPPNFYRLST